ncbi:hypothetical protein [Nostoc sp. ATCC 53789]|uniref:hypothetical protein n=1 Tax=Nostoc sp. ATCC 53789 TaxID=76335 RepID=UPI000DED29D2|nr:hypothetical protein [Nostoc sp. ATCC 53789]QHG21145.1 hypothetical protein GJB62_35430 [Nostoc sp. ATCC 53789]RCJ19467.1 hypothetical protein A6V25_26860 [Nostoc sp. ATCC 53789]
MSTNLNHFISARIPSKLDDEVENLAKRKGEKKSKILVNALDHYLKYYEAQEKSEENFSLDSDDKQTINKIEKLVLVIVKKQMQEVQNEFKKEVERLEKLLFEFCSQNTVINNSQNSRLDDQNSRLNEHFSQLEELRSKFKFYMRNPENIQKIQ